LYCPFPSAINRHAAAADEATLAWAQQWRLIDSARFEQLSLLRLGNLAGMTHPTAEWESLRLIADWCNWLFVHDDFCDDSLLGKQPELLEAWHGRLSSIMEGQPADTTTGLVGAFGDLWCRSTALGTPAWIARFRSHMQDFFDAHIWEAANRDVHEVPTVEAYLHYRPYTSGMFVYIDLIDIGYGFDFSSNLFEHPIFSQLRDHTARIVSWVNDIYSYRKELASGDLHSLVISIAVNGNMDYTQAVEEAVAIHDAEMRSFLEIETHLAAIAPDLQPEIKHYCAVVHGVIRGNMDWCASVARYASAAIEEKPELREKMVG
jgi:5-epi-alpha-selinene synthase